MSKEELKSYVINEMTKILLETGQSCDPEDMIAVAYNRAIDDAANSIDGEICCYEESSTSSQDEVIKGILKLKIRD